MGGGYSIRGGFNNRGKGLMPFPYQKIQCAHLCTQTIYPVLFLFPVEHFGKHSQETLMASIGVVPWRHIRRSMFRGIVEHWWLALRFRMHRYYLVILCSMLFKHDPCEHQYQRAPWAPVMLEMGNGVEAGSLGCDEGTRIRFWHSGAWLGRGPDMGAYAGHSHVPKLPFWFGQKQMGS